MYILYLDESGVQELDAGTSHFVLLGLAVRIDHWKTLDANIEREKDAFGLKGVEIHTAWMTRRYTEQESVAGFEALGRKERREAAEQAIKRRAGIIGVSGSRQKNRAYRVESKKIRPYLHLTRDERVACLESIAKEVAQWGHVRLFADAISKKDFVDGKFSPYELAFEQIVTRYQTFLVKQGQQGIIVSDNNDTAAPRLTALSRTFHEEGTLYRDIPNVVETPLFVNSALTSMIQVADLCAFALRRLLENGEDRLWGIIEPRVEMFNDVMVGVRHYTGKRACSCRICVAHKRRSAAVPAR
jgi:hypothetical protein